MVNVIDLNAGNNEILLATDHIMLNPIHVHSVGVSDTDPHAHNSQETIASIIYSLHVLFLMKLNLFHNT